MQKPYGSRGVEAIAKGLRKLISIDLSWCPITDTGLQALAEHSKGLISLNLSSCREVTDEGVQLILRNTSLQFLSLYGCPKITDETLREMAEFGRALQSLNLSYCERITNAGVRTLASYCEALKRLNISSCQRISGSVVNDLAYYLPNLEMLQLDKISMDDLASLSQKFPRLIELYLNGIEGVDRDEFTLREFCDAIRALCKTVTALKKLDLGDRELFKKELGEEFLRSMRERKIEVI